MSTPAQPTAAQTIVLREAILAAEAADRQPAYVATTPGMLARLRARVWVVAGSTEVTNRGRLAAGRPDTIALADVKPGDFLAYLTHPECVLRVDLVHDRKRGRDGLNPWKEGPADVH